MHYLKVYSWWLAFFSFQTTWKLDREHLSSLSSCCTVPAVLRGEKQQRISYCSASVSAMHWDKVLTEASALGRAL